MTPPHSQSTRAPKLNVIVGTSQQSPVSIAIVFRTHFHPGRCRARYGRSCAPSSAGRIIAFQGNRSQHRNIATQYIRQTCWSASSVACERNGGARIPYPVTRPDLKVGSDRVCIVRNCLRFALPAEAVWWLGGLEGKVGEVKVKIVYHHWLYSCRRRVRFIRRVKLNANPSTSGLDQELFAFTNTNMYAISTI